MKSRTIPAMLAQHSVRALRPADLESVIAIDAALSGRSRRKYFERRLAAALRDPVRHVQLTADDGGTLVGFVFGHLLEGEFGRSEPAMRLEALGVQPSEQHQGLGAALGAAFENAARRRGATAIKTAALWRDHGMLLYLDRAGYRLAAALVLDCALDEATLGSPREAPLEPLSRPADPNDYGTPGPVDFEQLARDGVEIGVLAEKDIEGAARVDRRHTGRDRRGFLCRVIGEALADSAVRVSLAARIDGAVAGFVMARVDYGDFGRAEPVAVIDSLGVDPMRLRHGIARAMLSQLFMNLAGLGVERVETIIDPEKLDLMALFTRAGFGPAERLAFVKSLP